MLETQRSVLNYSAKSIVVIWGNGSFTSSTCRRWSHIWKWSISPYNHYTFYKLKIRKIRLVIYLSDFKKFTSWGQSKYFLKNPARDTVRPISRGLKHHFWIGVIQYLWWVLYISRKFNFFSFFGIHWIINCIRVFFILFGVTLSLKQNTIIN